MILIFNKLSYPYETESTLRLFYQGHFRYMENKQPREIPEEEGDFLLTEVDGDGNITVALRMKGILREEHSRAVLSDEEKRKAAGETVLRERGRGMNREGNGAEQEIGRIAYRLLSEATGIRPRWGILTGIRPVKLFSEFAKERGEEGAKALLRDRFLVSEEKLDLAFRTAENQAPILSAVTPTSASLYVSIPFCPTRCRYCSFVSQSVEKAAHLIPAYCEHLVREIEEAGKAAREAGLTLCTVYFGGGTPGILSPEQIDALCGAIARSFDLSHVSEYTFEGGRPDTISPEKLAMLRKWGITRVSINPQTMQDSVLEAIGRRHTAAETADAFRMAREAGFHDINMDLIAGLTSDTAAGYRDTVEKVLALDPENITIHTLSLKRSSFLAEEKNPFSFTAEEIEGMLSYTYRRLSEQGYSPYYLYRQKNTLGNMENTGFAKAGYAGIYNVHMMEETQTVLAVGAGGVTKLRDPNDGAIERVFNFKYPEEYISQFDEILKRKRQVTEFYEKVLR